VPKSFSPGVFNVIQPFIDDVSIKGVESEYDEVEVMPGVRWHIMEHLQNFDAVLAEIELAGDTVSGTKLQLAKKGVELVGYWCTKEGRYPKVEKIMGRETCRNQKDVRAFLGTIVTGLRGMRRLSNP